jgi:hypothetical protein
MTTKKVEDNFPLNAIVEEVRERGRKLTQRFDNDPKKLFKELVRLAAQHPEKMVGQIRMASLPQQEAEEIENK